MGDVSRAGPELQVKWAEVRPRHGVAGAWIAIGLHLVVLAVAAAVSTEGDVTPVVAGFGAALVLTFAWLCACWRVDPAETTWTTAQPPPADGPAPSPIGFRAALRHGWRPLLAWLVAGTVVLAALRGLEGVAEMILLAWFMAPVGAMFGWLLWLFLVLPVRYLVAGAARLRSEGSPYAPEPTVPASALSPDEARNAMLARHATVPAPPLGVPMMGYAVVLLMALPVSFAVLESGAAPSRYDVIPALLGYGGAEPTEPWLLWLARAGFAVIIVTGLVLWWWLARARRRIEHHSRGFGEL